MKCKECNSFTNSDIQVCPECLIHDSLSENNPEFRKYSFDEEPFNDDEINEINFLTYQQILNNRLYLFEYLNSENIQVSIFKG